MMKYKGYMGIVRFDDEAELFVGHVLNIRDVITFEGRTVDDLRKSFQESVDFYLACCKADGVKPEKPFSGTIIVRTKPEIHRALSILAEAKGKSVNRMIGGILSHGAKKTAGSQTSGAKAKQAAKKKVLVGRKKSTTKGRVAAKD
jgi:predicted HicB family RNase H-like nuclease